MKQTSAQKRARLQQEAEALIEEFLEWEEGATRPNLTQIEEVALGLRERFGQRLAEVALEDQEAKQPVEAPRCEQCGQPMRYKGQKGVAIESRIGGLGIERGHYHCARCRSGIFPPGRAA
jgi:hypothetical protein